MTTFYFIRHGQADFSEANTKIYKENGFNMITLSEEGKKQIEAASKDIRLQKADLIITSPYGRTLHTAAILSRNLGLEIVVETDLHEWAADRINYTYLSDEEAKKCYQELTDNKGKHPEGKPCTWESAEQMKARVFEVLKKYKDHEAVIVCCHGTLMQYVLEIPHPGNGEIVEYTKL